MEPMIDPNYKQKKDAEKSRKSLMLRLGIPSPLTCPDTVLCLYFSHTLSRTYISTHLQGAKTNDSKYLVGIT